MKQTRKIALMSLMEMILEAAGAQAEPPRIDSEKERGRYVICNSRCNDCHTLG